MDVSNVITSLGSLGITLAIAAIGVCLLVPAVAVWGWGKLAELFDFEQLKANYTRNYQIKTARQHYKDAIKKVDDDNLIKYYRSKVKSKSKYY